MTHEATERPRGFTHADFEAEILAALWEQVPFPSLPNDAPPELRELVVEIENPKRVYSIYRATRRHNLQSLVEKFIRQLRYGCGCDDCPTASCFSCRRRLAGKAPIRRYSPMSARTLAIQLASQDNPDQYLCPYLESSRQPSDAIKPLIFGPKPRLARSELDDGLKTMKANRSARNSSTGGKGAVRRHVSRREDSSAPKLGLVVPKRDPHHKYTSDHGQELDCEASRTDRAERQISINERPVRKDYRSFAANVFGSVAFKMVEWLTPNNLDAISNKAAAALGHNDCPGGSQLPSSPDESEDDLFVASSSSADPEDISPNPKNVDHAHTALLNDSRTESIAVAEPPRRSSSVNGSINGITRPVRSRTNSSARVRTATKPMALSTDPISEVRLDESIHAPHSPISPPSTGPKSRHKLAKTSPPPPCQQPIEQLTNSMSHEHESYHLETCTPESPKKLSIVSEFRRSSQVSSHRREETDSTEGDGHAPKERSHQDDCGSISGAELPQSLSLLNSEIIEFFCDVLHEDGTAESHLLEPQVVPRSITDVGTPKGLTRRVLPHKTIYRHLKLEWKLFVEQSIFSVLSDPHAIIGSFVTEDGLMDSQTLWWHMLRMTRTTPALVFDSLWQAAASLFTPPSALKNLRSPTGNAIAKHGRYLSNEQAGWLMSVCFHALVAAAPLVQDAALLFELSRIRSRGLTLSETGATASTALCLQYEDALTDDMAIRLTRRLLAAIPVRGYFDDLADLNVDNDEGSNRVTVLDVLLAHLEPGRETQPSSNFSYAERETHEKRVPILLLDWARTIMLKEWQGQPDVPSDGPFGGALSLIAAMHQKRKSLLLGDSVFRTEYFGERLDAIDMPVTWLAFAATRQRAHLLDYPYIFHPSSLVSYFRAINFSRMSRSYEESSSLQTRISAIIATDSLVTDQHQKGVLQDLLKVASSKFLILDIGRKTVVRDAFDQLWRRQGRELLRPLKVHLGEDTGEEGFDSGGVQQEFFRLAIAEVLNPDFGAFTVDDRTRMTWFRPGSLQSTWKFELVGLLVSLAVFNGLTLPVTFPKALYMKLLNEPVTELHHIADGWPDLANGLTTLLEWNEADGAIEDIFARTYEFSIDMFGQPVSRQMESSHRVSWPQFPQYSSDASLTSGNPEDAPLVTSDNREAYVSDYIRYLTDISVAPQYEAFARGFRTCLNSKSLQILNPPLLQSIVEGTQEIDISELRRAARYVGWDTSHRTVRDFWSIVKRYDDRMKRKLLEFVTASDRVPVGGMRNVQFVVQRNGAEEGEGGHLPTAYTCYGTLLLPEYRDREILRERLGMALENAQGFGFA